MQTRSHPCPAALLLSARVAFVCLRVCALWTTPVHDFISMMPVHPCLLAHHCTKATQIGVSSALPGSFCRGEKRSCTASTACQQYVPPRPSQPPPRAAAPSPRAKTGASARTGCRADTWDNLLEAHLARLPGMLWRRHVAEVVALQVPAKVVGEKHPADPHAAAQSAAVSSGVAASSVHFSFAAAPAAGTAAAGRCPWRHLPVLVALRVSVVPVALGVPVAGCTAGAIPATAPPGTPASIMKPCAASSQTVC